MSETPSLSLFFPCFDEAENLPTLIEECASFIAGYDGEAEVVVVDDGSRDGTPGILDGLKGRHPFLRSVRHDRNRGYGAALKTGFSSCRMELVFFSDGDNQFRLNRLGEFIAAIAGGADAVIGFREERKDPLGRKVNAWCWNRLVSSLFGLALRDVNCAYKLFTRRSLEGLQLRAEGALINTELLVRLSRAGRRIVELPVDHYPRTRGRPTGANPLVIMRAFRELVRFYRDLEREGR